MKEKLIAEFGEQYRKLIANLAPTLDEKEPTWKLRKPINRRNYIKGLIEHVVLPVPDTK